MLYEYAFFCPYQLPVTLPVTMVPVSVPTLAAVLLGIQDQHAAYLVSSECSISLQSITSIVNLQSEQIHAYLIFLCTGMLKLKIVRVVVG